MPAAVATSPPRPGSLTVLTLQALKGILLVHPGLWQLLATLVAPIRLTLAVNLWAGRSLRSLAAELTHRLLLLVGWLAGRVEHPGLRRSLERRRWFLLRRWHLAASVLALAQAARWAHGAWRDAASGRAARRRELRQQLRAAESMQEW